MTALKWTAIGLTALLLFLLAFYVYNDRVVNPRVIQELRQHPDGPRASKAMLLTLPSGRMLPVNFLLEGNRVYAGSDGAWWREFRGDGGRVTMLIRGRTLTGHGVAVLDDPAHVEDVFSRLRAAVPDWLPRWLDAKMVEITLDPGQDLPSAVSTDNADHAG